MKNIGKTVCPIILGRLKEETISLRHVLIDGTDAAGKFKCDDAALVTGDHVTITGTISTSAGTGSIAGYTTGATYKVFSVTE